MRRMTLLEIYWRLLFLGVCQHMYMYPSDIANTCILPILRNIASIAIEKLLKQDKD